MFRVPLPSQRTLGASSSMRRLGSNCSPFRPNGVTIRSQGTKAPGKTSEARDRRSPLTTWCMSRIAKGSYRACCSQKQALAQIAKSGGLRFHSEQFFQIIPIKMKRAISVRRATLMIATVRNTSVADRGFMSCLASCEAPKPNCGFSQPHHAEDHAAGTVAMTVTAVRTPRGFVSVGG